MFTSWLNNNIITNYREQQRARNSIARTLVNPYSSSSPSSLGFGVEKGATNPMKVVYAEKEDRLYSCANCRTPLAYDDELISRNFHGRHGRAYLFNKALNVVYGQKEERVFFTGHHVVCDVICMECHTILGWKYLKAREKSQQYKINKLILEHKLILKENWDLGSSC